MPGTVYFTDARARSGKENKTAKVGRLFAAAGLAAVVKPGDLCAVKVHFGELGSDGHVRPTFARAVVEAVRALGATPFLTDTNTLYSGSRHNAVDHMRTAMVNGFSYASVGAPVIIADGLRGENVAEVAVGLKHFAAVKIAGAIAQADSMIVLSHFKGHEMAGFGGAIKNLAMGCSPGSGKRDQHSPRFVVEAAKCVGCGECAAVCPEGAAAMGEEGKAFIDKSLCVGCGECFQRCPEKAIQIDWATQLPPFMERMTEYALGAVKGKEGRVGYMNFLLNVTPDCDCCNWSDSPIVPDLGIAAGLDPVALDQACFDMVNKAQGIAGTHLKTGLAPGEDKFARLWPHTRADIQLAYGEAIGLGARAYEIARI